MQLNDYTIHVPYHWSSDEALTFVRFLEELTQAIWNLHGEGMASILENLASHDGTSTDTRQTEAERAERAECAGLDDWPF